MFKRFFIFTVLFVIIAFTPKAFAQFEDTFKSSTSDINGGKGASLVDQLNENLRKQEELRRKIAAAQEKERNLSVEIAYLDDQISLTKLEMEETKTRLGQLSVDIGSVSAQLEETKNDLNYTTNVANSRLRSIYKQSFVGSMESFLGTSSFNEFLTKQKYTEAIRQQDLELLQNLESLKNKFSQQKVTLEDKQEKEQALKTDLEKQTADLSNQQGSKQYILGVTKSNEQTYKALLAQVQQEIAAIARLLGGGVKLGPVKRGEIIAFQGNTGCSTGSHLHFGLYLNPNNPFSPTNPRPYLNSGALRWPLNSPRVTQPFGWVWSSAIGPHTGIDMQTNGWSPQSGEGSPIYAAKDGVAYLSTDNGCPWLGSIITGTVPGKWIKIVHNNGWATIYGHIQ